MFQPKCYTLINRVLAIKDQIRRLFTRIRQKLDELEDRAQDHDRFLELLEYIDADSETFTPSHTDEDKHLEEIWKLIRHRNQLILHHPREFAKFRREERRESRETHLMMLQDDPKKM